MMMNKTIEWQEPEQHIKQERVSKDKRWHLSTAQPSDPKTPALFLTNYDLLLSPYGNGANCQECFETFIRNCETFIDKVKTARNEAEIYLRQLHADEQETANENRNSVDADFVRT